MRDFPAALAAKILRHHMQREVELNQNQFVANSCLQASSPSIILYRKRTQNIISFCGAEREPAKQACYESCEASSCVLQKFPKRIPRVPDKLQFAVHQKTR